MARMYMNYSQGKCLLETVSCSGSAVRRPNTYFIDVWGLLNPVSIKNSAPVVSDISIALTMSALTRDVLQSLSLNHDSEAPQFVASHPSSCWAEGCFWSEEVSTSPRPTRARAHTHTRLYYKYIYIHTSSTHNKHTST